MFLLESFISPQKFILKCLCIPDWTATGISKEMVLKEKGKSECLAKNILKHVGCRELYVNKLIHCTFMGISPPQNLRLSEDKNFVSHPPSKKGKKTSICTEKKLRIDQLMGSCVIWAPLSWVYYWGREPIVMNTRSAYWLSVNMLTKSLLIYVGWNKSTEC